jgi:hypothetical protein
MLTRDPCDTEWLSGAGMRVGFFIFLLTTVLCDLGLVKLPALPQFLHPYITVQRRKTPTENLGSFQRALGIRGRF